MQKLILLLVALCSSLCAKDFTLIWHVGEDPSHFWETEWVTTLLDGFEYDTVIDIKDDTVVDNALIILNGYNPSIIDKYKEKKLKFGVIHLSDEAYNHDTSFYPDVPFILRNYWHKDLAPHPNVHFFALGIKRGFWDNSDRILPSLDDRPYSWSFAGQTEKSTRRSMKDALVSIKDHFLFEIGSFNDPKSLSTGEYRQIILKTKLVPCPRGFCNVDSFRTYEALESGAIPIVEQGDDDYYQNLFPNNPFITVKKWKKAPKIMRKLLKKKRKMEAKRQECIAWWSNYKKALKEKVRSLITEHVQATQIQHSKSS